MQWDTHLVSSFCSRDSHGLAEASSGLHCGPTAFLDQSYFFSFPFTSDAPQQTCFIPPQQSLMLELQQCDQDLIPRFPFRGSKVLQTIDVLQRIIVGTRWLQPSYSLFLSLAEKSSSHPRTS